jgi:NitT/TauT family transport system permease protein
MVKKSYILAIQCSIVLTLLLVWELISTYEVIKPLYISSPSRIWNYIINGFKDGFLIKHLLVTLNEAFWGLFLGVFLGAIFGVLFALNKTIDNVFQPFVSMFNAMPRLAFAPIIMLWFGFGLLSKVVIVVSMVFFVIFFNIYHGIKEINPILLKNSITLGATKMQIIRNIYIPSIFGWIFASLRLAVAYSIISAILGEYVGASEGLGFLIDNAQSMFNSTAVFGGIVVLMVVTLIIDKIIIIFEQKTIKWKEIV